MQSLFEKRTLTELDEELKRLGVNLMITHLEINSEQRFASYTTNISIEGVCYENDSDNTNEDNPALDFDRAMKLLENKDG